MASRLRRPNAGDLPQDPQGSLGSAVPETSSPDPQGDQLPIPSAPPSYSVLSQPRRWGFPSKPSAQSSVLALTLPERTPGTATLSAPPRGRPGPSGSDPACPSAVGLVRGTGGVSLSRCCPVPCHASARSSASRLPYPPRAPARVPPAAPATARPSPRPARAATCRGRLASAPRRRHLAFQSDCTFQGVNSDP